MAQHDTRSNMSVAKDSKTIAIASKKDSSAMKSIAVVTMTFLPATFVSVRAFLTVKRMLMMDHQN